jgi:hypothetical protein
MNAKRTAAHNWFSSAPHAKVCDPNTRIIQQKWKEPSGLISRPLM